MSTSGYPRIVKRWERGQPLAQAKTLYEGKSEDVAVQPAVFYTPAGTIAVIERGMTFFPTEYQWLAHDGTLHRLPLPEGADLKGAQAGHLILTLRDDWTPAAGARIGK